MSSDPVSSICTCSAVRILRKEISTSGYNSLNSSAEFLLEKTTVKSIFRGTQVVSLGFHAPQRVSISIVGINHRVISLFSKDTHFTHNRSSCVLWR